MDTKLIYQKIPDIMAEIGAIGKDRKNEQQHYQFRGIDDVYNELHDLLAKHRVFTIPEVLEERTEDRQGRSGNTLIYRVLKIRYTFVAEDSSSFAAVVMGEGMDSGDKAANKAMSVAHKYALLQVFAIPTEDPKDPCNDSPELAPKPKKSSPKKGKANGQKNDLPKITADRVRELDNLCHGANTDIIKVAMKMFSVAPENLTVSQGNEIEKRAKTHLAKQGGTDAPTPEELDDLATLLRAMGKTIASVNEKYGIKSLAKLTRAQYDEVRRELEN